MQAQLLYAAPSSEIDKTVVQNATLTNDSTGESSTTKGESLVYRWETWVQLVSFEDASKVDVNSIKININDGAINNNAQLENGSIMYNSDTRYLNVSTKVREVHFIFSFNLNLIIKLCLS